MKIELLSFRVMALGIMTLRKLATITLLVIGLLLQSSECFADLLLTGASAFSADSTGGRTEPNRWNTAPGDPWYNLYFTTPNTGMSGAFLNSGDGSTTNLQFALLPGSYQFYIFTEPGFATPFSALNLFFDGDPTNPGISVFAPLATSTSHPPFLANSNADTLALDGQTIVPGSGSLSITALGVRVELTSYSWSDPSVYALDRVARFDLGSNGINDFVGSITLTVTPIPEPNSTALLGVGVAALLGYRRKT